MTFNTITGCKILHCAWLQTFAVDDTHAVQSVAASAVSQHELPGRQFRRRRQTDDVRWYADDLFHARARWSGTA